MSGTWLQQVMSALGRLEDGDAHWIHDRCSILLDGSSPDAWWGELAESLATYARQRRGCVPDHLLAEMPACGDHALYVYLLRLEVLARSLAGAPAWEAVVVCPEPIVTATQHVSIEQGVILSPSQFVSTFDALLRRGYAWINLTAAGVLNGALLVEVETHRVAHTGVLTSVNLSGPMRFVAERGWKLDDLVQVVGPIQPNHSPERTSGS